MQNAMNQRESTKERAGGPAGALWLVQAFTGLLLVLLLLLHMVAHHFVVQGGLRNFDQVVDYVSNPAIFFITILFLIVTSIHAMLGVRAILMDFGLGRGAQRAVNWLLALAGVATIVYGVWLEIAIISQ